MRSPRSSINRYLAGHHKGDRREDAGTALRACLALVVQRRVSVMERVAADHILEYVRRATARVCVRRVRVLLGVVVDDLDTLIGFSQLIRIRPAMHDKETAL